MHRRLLYMTAGLVTVAVLGWLSTWAAESKGGPLGGDEKPAPSAAPAKEEGSSCGSHGTAVDFEDTPSEAARKALKQEKLVFVLHVSGLFEDPNKT